LARDLAEGLAAGRQRLEQIARNPNQPKLNGWHAALHCDYNLDWFQIGTIDDPAWKLPNRDAAHLARAMVARGGLWGNHGYEAAYYIVFEDGQGNQLSGANRYRLRFDRPPPPRRSGRSPCTTCPTTSWSTTRSAATRSATAPPDWPTPTTAP
jgi:hypothetical protein